MRITLGQYNNINEDCIKFHIKTKRKIYGVFLKKYRRGFPGFSIGFFYGRKTIEIPRYQSKLWRNRFRMKSFRIY